jgi:hypothetical protein
MAELPYGVREGQGMRSTPLIISVGGFSMRVFIAKGRPKMPLYNVHCVLTVDA